MRVSLLLILFFFSGCATFDRPKCESPNWYGMGRTDGLEGQPEERFYRHSQACAAQGVEPNWPSYWKGRQAGLETFCDPDRAFRLGRLGLPRPEVCPEKAFQAAYQRGQLSTQVHVMERQIAEMENEVENLETEEERKALEQEIAALKRTKRSFQ